MSEPAAKHRQMIDLEEFERRLSRSPAPANARGSADPLAELARLVDDGEDRYGSMFQTRPARARATEPAREPPRQQPAVEPHVPDWLVEEAHQHQHAQPPAQKRSINFDAIEAGLRGSLPPEFQDYTDAEDRYLHDAHQGGHHHAESDDFAEDSNWLDAPYVAPQEPYAEPPRSRVALYATAAIILAGMAGIGGTFALKRTPAAPQEIALIKASTIPVKVAVPGADTSAAADNTSILDKTAAPAPTAAVSQTEQPVDVNAVGKPAPAQQVDASAPATAVPVPAPPGGDATQDLAGMMQPHRVKTVAVRPDGSLADSPDSGAPAADAAAGAQPPASAMAPPSMAAGGASLAAPAPEMARTAPASDDLPWSPQAAQPSAPAPAADAPAPAPQRPVHMARAETGADDADAASASDTGGSFSVQLAAPGSESEAHSALVRLSRTYGAELHGYRLKYRLAKVNGKTVYRVRVNGLSHKSAISLCEKLKAKGASCFPARG
ncbi:MAG: SPOR domain-containing protein [Pseudomonadota bacterium]